MGGGGGGGVSGSPPLFVLAQPTEVNKTPASYSFFSYNHFPFFIYTNLKEVENNFCKFTISAQR